MKVSESKNLSSYPENQYTIIEGHVFCNPCFIQAIVAKHFDIHYKAIGNFSNKYMDISTTPE